MAEWGKRRILRTDRSLISKLKNNYILILVDKSDLHFSQWLATMIEGCTGVETVHAIALVVHSPSFDSGKSQFV
jgi:hypothetical protein